MTERDPSVDWERLARAYLQAVKSGYLIDRRIALDRLAESAGVRLDGHIEEYQNAGY